MLGPGALVSPLEERTMFGLVEVITLLLGLSGFGLQPNPKAPTADQSLQYAMPDADVVVHFDAASVIPNNYKALLQLADQPQIKASPELAKMVRQMVNEVEGARGIAKTATGIDLATDITDGTLFLQVVPNHEPNFVAAVRGKLSTAVVDKIAKMSGKQASKVDGGMIIETGANDPAIGVTKDGVMLAGTPKLVRDRLSDSWKTPARAVGSNLAYAQDTINAKPVFAVVVTLSPTARKEIQSKMGPTKNFITDVVARHKAFSFAMFHDGIGWTWVDSTKAGLDQMAMISDGTMDLLRSFQIAPRGFAKILLGAIDSYKGSDKRVDEIIRRKADLMKIVETYTGDGNFKVQIDKDVKALRLTARATGKSLSEVIPAGVIGPGMILGFVMMRGNAKMSAPMPSQSTQPVPAPRPAQPPAKRP